MTPAVVCRIFFQRAGSRLIRVNWRYWWPIFFSALDAGATALEDVHEVIEIDLARVAARGL